MNRELAAKPLAGLKIPNLIEGLSDGGSPSGAEMSKLWFEKRGAILQKVLRVIGGLPPSVTPAYTLINEERTSGGSVLRKKIAYDTYDGDRVTAYLLLPAEKISAVRKLPAMLALHPTVLQGKDAVAGVSGDPNDAYGLELAERGYVVLVPDILSAGDRVFEGLPAYHTAPFEEKYPKWSMIGKMIYDHKAGVDLLNGLEFVDGNRIGAVGHSLGCYNAFFLAAFDERVRAVICSCGFYPLAGDDYPQRWAKRDFTHIPAMGAFLDRGDVPFEFNEVAAAIAPRAFFNWSAQCDEIYGNWRSVGEALLTVKEVYESLDSAERFTTFIGQGGHGFPPLVRECAYRWLDRQLKGGAQTGNVK